MFDLLSNCMDCITSQTSCLHDAFVMQEAFKDTLLTKLSILLGKDSLLPNELRTGLCHFYRVLTLKSDKHLTKPYLLFDSAAFDELTKLTHKAS